MTLSRESRTKLLRGASVVLGIGGLLQLGKLLAFMSSGSPPPTAMLAAGALMGGAVFVYILSCQK